MITISIDADHDSFLADGKPWFYFADTVWSVFSNATVEEWAEYLDYRREQGFTALQISVLPILHDASETYQGLVPFATRSDGSWDFDTPNPDFFQRAEAMVKMAVERDFVVALFVLWGNYVKDTKFSDKDPSHIMPLEAVRPYSEFVARTFAPYRPMYCISGDTNFGSKTTVEYYLTALEAVKSVDPQAVTSFHLQPSVQLPEEVRASKLLDFYMYQAGHRLEEHDFNYRLAEEFLAYRQKRPIVNGEPSYEGHGHGMRYGRFDSFHVRKAFWQSVLSGAKAGFTYGAHGVWSWHRRGAAFTSVEWSKTPFDWRTALRFPGAWDAAYSKWLFERYRLFDVVPRNDLLKSPYPDIRIAAMPDLSRVVVYAPYSVEVTLDIDPTGYETETIVLGGRNVAKPRVHKEGGTAVVDMIEANSDTLTIFTRT